MNTDQVRSVSSQIITSVDDLQSQIQLLIGSVRSMDWIGGARDRYVNDIENLCVNIFNLSNHGASLGHHALLKASNWEEVAQYYSSSQVLGTSTSSSTDLSSPTETIEIESEKANGVVDTFINAFSDLGDSIEIIKKNKLLLKIYNETFENFGRALNKLGNTRGYIKKMGLLGDIIKDGGEAISAINNISFLNTSKNFFSGEVTNAVMVQTVAETLIPIPGIGRKIGEWAASVVFDPNGRWQGLVGKVQ